MPEQGYDQEETPSVKRERALSDEELHAIEINFYRGLYNDEEVKQLLDTVRILRTILRTMFSHWTNEPLLTISTADPVRTIALAELKKLAAMESET